MHVIKTPLSPPTLREKHRWDGLRIGLLGGSFNPPHAGHLHIARLAQAKFGLDFVWWVVTPQNPLKENSDIRPYDKRFRAVEDMLKQHPRQMPTHIESELATTYTYQTVESLRYHFPYTDFIWICGMDNALIFHKWDQWQYMLSLIPICFIARPPAGQLVKGCALRQYRKIPHYYSTMGRRTDLKKKGIYWLKANKMLDISSTSIRNKKLF